MPLFVECYYKVQEHCTVLLPENYKYMYNVNKIKSYYQSLTLAKVCLIKKLKGSNTNLELDEHSDTVFGKYNNFTLLVCTLNACN